MYYDSHRRMWMQLAVVTVAFPATPLLLARARICISASHTREDLLKGLEVIYLSMDCRLSSPYFLMH